MVRFSVIVLGGYGLFGSRIVRRLARERGWRIVVAGRDGTAAVKLCDALRRDQAVAATLVPLACDIHATGFCDVLQREGARLVINTCGPFQRQDYAIARAALDADADYIDLADARDYVAGFGALDDAARGGGRVAIAGASTVPGLSAAVVDHFVPAFAHLDAIDIGISPGNRTPRGLATVAAILGYVGRPLPWLEDHRRRTVAGWQSLRRHRYPAPAGTRWLAACDVPDLDLFPRRYAGLRALRFRAGLELKRLHLALWLLSWLVRAGLVRSLDRHARAMKSLSERFERMGGDAGAMHVEIEGFDRDGQPLGLRWQLVAEGGDGPEIPATAAVLLARKIAAGDVQLRGAMPCVGLFTLEEFLAALDGYAIKTSIERFQPRNRIA
ncbi:MAG TPA: saccharopine dehydrogenase NADP-binding domain-containing protein [Rhodanobacteraceae bacterium]|nr:saccharopine dehydrogenase NADP-binding domain-containing protein [Rhodanobacteraceae bacterium]